MVIRLRVVQIMLKKYSAYAVVRYYYRSYDNALNWTTLSPITITYIILHQKLVYLQEFNNEWLIT